MKTQSLNTRITALMSVLVAVIVLMSCSKDVDVPTPSSYPANDGPTGNLSATEQIDLRFMAEKEKLMTIVYQETYDIYNDEVFMDISKCKERHMNKLSARIDKYELENPIAYLADNEFENSNLQQVYNSFIASGHNGLPQALNFLKSLEEQHIDDIEGFVAHLDDNGDILSVYNLCLNESQEHLDLILGFSKIAKGFEDIIKPFDPVRIP